MIKSVDDLLAQHIEWLESLQRGRVAHMEMLAAVIARKQLEIDNLKQISSTKQVES